MHQKSLLHPLGVESTLPKMRPSIVENLGIKEKSSPHKIFFHASPNVLVRDCVRWSGGELSKSGALVVKTGKHTGRSAKDKYVVKNERTRDSIWWDNSLSAMSPEVFAQLKRKVVDYFNGDLNLYVTHRSIGALPEHNCGICLITTHPQHALFSEYLFRPPMKDFGGDDFCILHAPLLEPDPKEFGVRSSTIIATCFDLKMTIITGTLYAGEIKKSMFCVLNYLLPEKGILPMHSGASRLQDLETSIFFGLSGTGKTTLSTDRGTKLIGDDEHGLTEQGIFNFEGGCYAKTYQLSASGEPGIFKAAATFGALLENVVLTPDTGEPDYFDDSLSENGRCSYPLDFIEDIEKSSCGKIPRHVFFLCADAFGILPPLAALSKKQALFYFVLGYTAKVAGTEVGVSVPEATFSPCFGAPFMLRHPSVYAKILGSFLDKHDIRVWLVNTGWTGGPCGVGQRFPLNVTREIVRAVQANKLNRVKTFKDPLFEFDVPESIPNVPTTFLNPRKTWLDPKAYDAKAKELVESFRKQMGKFRDIDEY